MPDTTSIGTLAPHERVALGGAGLRTFFRLADHWGLSVADQCALLGDIGRSTHHAWRQRVPESVESYTTDRLTRLSYLLGIYGMVQRLYGETPAYADAWLTSPNTSAAFGGRSPLAIMRERGIPGMHLVRRLLEAAAGGGLEPADEVAWEGPTVPAAYAGANVDADEDVERP